jgi:uncharacterized membrane protein YkvA (DUF1232 family)
VSEKSSEKIIKEGARKVTTADIMKVINKSREIRSRFRGRGPLSRFVEDARLMLSIVKDYWAGRYRRVPYGFIAAVVFVLLYVINPFDLMPDFLPIIGEIDDAAIVGASLLALERDLFQYRAWKQSQLPALPAPDDAPGPPAES